MPTVAIAELERGAAALLRAAGAPEDVARVTADAIVGADVVEHESHGVVRGYGERVPAETEAPARACGTAPCGWWDRLSR